MVLQLNILFFFFLSVESVFDQCCLSSEPSPLSPHFLVISVLTDPPELRLKAVHHKQASKNLLARRPEATDDLKSRFWKAVSSPGRQAGRQAGSVLYLKEDTEKKWQTRIIDQ